MSHIICTFDQITAGHRGQTGSWATRTATTCTHCVCLCFSFFLSFFFFLLSLFRARCSSVVRAFVHGAMGRRNDPSWWTHWAISRSSQCYPVCGMVHIKEPLLLIGKSGPCGGSRFPLSLSEWSFTICLKEGNVLFNDALNTFYLGLYGVRHMVKDHSDSEKGNPLPPHRLLFPINSKGSFICTIPQTG